MSRRDENYLALAGRYGSKRRDMRTFHVGAVGLRADGAVVYARNEAKERQAGDAHAEARLAQKLDVGAEVWVARVSREDGSMKIAKPCKHCERALRRRGVRRVVYTTGPNTFDWLLL